MLLCIPEDHSILNMRFKKSACYDTDASPHDDPVHMIKKSSADPIDKL